MSKNTYVPKMYLECLINPLIYIILIHFQFKILLKINWKPTNIKNFTEKTQIFDFSHFNRVLLGFFKWEKPVKTGW